MIYLGMGDLTKALGHPGNDRHPDVREVIGRIVGKAQSRDIAVCANALGYQDGVDLSELIADGVESLWKLGVKAVLVPRPTMILQYFYEKTLERVRARLLLKSLIYPEGMGETFQVLIQQKGVDRRDLTGLQSL